MLHMLRYRVENMSMIMNSSIRIWTFVKVLAWSENCNKTSTQNNLCDVVSGFLTKKPNYFFRPTRRTLVWGELKPKLNNRMKKLPISKICKKIFHVREPSFCLQIKKPRNFSSKSFKTKITKTSAFFFTGNFTRMTMPWIPSCMSTRKNGTRTWLFWPPLKFLIVVWLQNFIYKIQTLLLPPINLEVQSEGWNKLHFKLHPLLLFVIIVL